MVSEPSILELTRSMCVNTQKIMEILTSIKSSWDVVQEDWKIIKESIQEDFDSVQEQAIDHRDRTVNVLAETRKRKQDERKTEEEKTNLKTKSNGESKTLKRLILARGCRRRFSGGWVAVVRKPKESVKKKKKVVNQGNIILSKAVVAYFGAQVMVFRVSSLGRQYRSSLVQPKKSRITKSTQKRKRNQWPINQLSHFDRLSKNKRSLLMLESNEERDTGMQKDKGSDGNLLKNPNTDLNVDLKPYTNAEFLILNPKPSPYTGPNLKAKVNSIPNPGLKTDPKPDSNMKMNPKPEPNPILKTDIKPYPNPDLKIDLEPYPNPYLKMGLKRYSNPDCNPYLQPRQNSVHFCFSVLIMKLRWEGLHSPEEHWDGHISWQNQFLYFFFPP